MTNIKKTSLSLAVISILGISFTGCGDDGDSVVTKTGTFKDSLVHGIEYSCGSTVGITNMSGHFNYTSECDEVNLFIGGVNFGSVSTDVISDYDDTVYPVDLLNVDRNNTTNTSLVNMIRVFQTLDDDNNPYNGIEISEETRIALENVSIDLASPDTTLSDLEYIANAAGKILIDSDYAIAHYEDTLRNDLNLTVRTVPPAPAVYDTVQTPTNSDITQVTINGVSGSSIFINGEDINQTIDNSNSASITLDTSGGDGEIANIVTLKDILNQESDEFNAVLIKDTISPVLEIEDLTIDENSDENITITATDIHGINYTISGSDAEKFNIDSSTGILSFKDKPDYEFKETYSLNVLATDTAGNSDTKALNISINHLNDEIPNIPSTDIYVEEGTIDPIQLGTIDLDKDEEQTLTYTITGGEDAEYFIANTAISFTELLDDQNPQDANHDNIYKINIKVSDGINESEEKALNITVTPKNENAPIITSASTVEIDENFIGVIYSTTYTDGDDMPQNFIFSIDGEDANYFSINNTGEISILESLDYDTQNSYSLSLYVNDGVNTTTKALTVNLTRVFVNSAPTISNLSATSLRVAAGESSTFNYSVSDENEDQSLTCTFDFNGDGTVDDTVFNCTNGTVTYTFPISGNFTPLFNVTDGTETVSSSDLAVMIEDGYGSIQGNISDYFTGSDLYNAIIKLMYNGELYSEISADLNGYYTFPNILSGDYEIVFDYNGYILATGSASVDVETTSTYQKVEMVPDGVEAGTFTGNIKDAVSGSVISNSTVKIYSGFNSTSTLISTNTLSGSNFDYELDPGYYTIVVQKNDYIDAMYTISVGSDRTTNKDLIISPTIGEGEIRVVLSWGASPSDLDSHMTKVKNDSNVYHIYYGDSSSSEGSLDTDDTSSYGPETITLNNMEIASGVDYYYYVHNYSGYPSFSNSNAKVEIYYGNQTYTAYVPSGSGDSWKVFDINNGQISICQTDCISDTNDYYRTLNRTSNELDIFNNLPAK